jgi:lysophospholipase
MFRPWLAVLLLLVLAGCGRESATGPFADGRTPPDLGPRFFAPEGWAWGYVQVGDKPPQRYGVAATWRAPRAHIVILPGYGESAETWFETVRALTRQGYSVWVLDRAGQGGSGRYTLPRDLGYAPSFAPDVAALTSLVRVVIRPRSGTPLVLLGASDGAVVALRAVEQGLRSDGLILSSPRLAPAAPEAVKGLAGRIPGLDRLPDRGWRAWSRADPDDRARGLTHDPWRGGVSKSWQTANPDLRMSAPSRGWRSAFARASDAAAADAARVATPVVMLTAGAPQPRVGGLCKAMRDCRLLPILDARASLHLEADPWRAIWLASVSEVVAGKVDIARDPQTRDDRAVDPDRADDIPRPAP